MTTYLTRLVLLLAILVVAPSAFAQPSPDVIKKANGHFKLGQEFFKSGQFDRAIEEYQRALDLTGEPLMVFNIALAHDRANRPEVALELYLKYLEQAPDGEGADEARQYVARLTPIVDKIKADRAAEEQRKATDNQRAKDDAARSAEHARKVEAARSSIEELEGRGRTRRWIGIGVAGVGLIALGVGVKFGLDARSIANDLEGNQTGWTDALIARDAEGQSANTKMIVFTSIGGAAILTGAVFYFLGHRDASAAEQMRVDVSAGAGGGTVTMTGRF